MTKEEKNFVILVLRQRWMASTLSDLQTFSIMCAPFALNTLYLGNNGWLNFSIFLAVMLWIFGKVFTASKKTKRITQLQTTDIDEAISFIEEQRGK